MCKARLTRSEVIFDLDKRQAEIAVLDAQMSRENFWDDIEGAQEVVKRRGLLQSPAQRWQGLMDRVEDAGRAVGTSGGGR